MADVVENTNAEVTVDNPSAEVEQENTPTMEEVLEQLAQEKAEKERLKNANNKLSKSEAEMKRQLRAKMTTAEAEEEARKEAEAEKDAKFKEMADELNLMKAKASYTSVFSDEQTIENLVEAIADADHKGIALIVKTAIDNAVKQAEKEWYKNRPQPNLGTDSSMTKEQILAIEDDDERIRAIAQHRNLF